jgi:hypothetical protein
MADASKWLSELRYARKSKTLVRGLDEGSRMKDLCGRCFDSLPWRCANGDRLRVRTGVSIQQQTLESRYLTLQEHHHITTAFDLIVLMICDSISFKSPKETHDYKYPAFSTPHATLPYVESCQVHMSLPFSTTVHRHFLLLIWQVNLYDYSIQSRAKRRHVLDFSYVFLFFVFQAQRLL